MQNVAKIFNLFLSIVFLVLFIVFALFDFNPSLFLVSIFMFVGLLDLHLETKFEKINTFTKHTKNFSKPIFLYVTNGNSLGDLLKKIETTKTIVFCLELQNGRIIFLSEKMVQKMSINYGIEKKLNEIIKKY